MRWLALILAPALLACGHTTAIGSVPSGAAVYLDDAVEPAGVTPFELRDPSQRVRVEKDGRAASFRLKRQTDWGYAAVNTCIACAGSAAILALLGGGIYALGSLIGWSMPVIGPIIAVLGAPPALCGTLFWSAVGGLACGAITLPLQAFAGASVGPRAVVVDLEQGTVTTDPPARWEAVEALPPTSQPSSAPVSQPSSGSG